MRCTPPAAALLSGASGVPSTLCVRSTDATASATERSCFRKSDAWTT